MNMRPEKCMTDLCAFFRKERLGLPERWILSRFYSTLALVEKCLAGYRFNEAANAIYEFFWHDFCDWYIEIAKASLDADSTQVILYKVLEKSLRMLHPFMPFVTEEIWDKLPRGRSDADDSIMIQPWPHIQKEMVSKKDEARMRETIDLVTAIRNIRSIWNIEPHKEVAAAVNVRGKRDGELFTENAVMIKRLARLSGLEIGTFPKPKNSAMSVVGRAEVYVALEGMIDIGKERSRLEKEREKSAGEIDSIARRLKDRSFLSKAPKDVIEKQRSRREDLEAQKKRLDSNLKNMQ
jgi:valyl-tRNA synthetase